MATGKEIATTVDDQFALVGYAPDSADSMSIVQENLRGDGITEFDLPRVKVPAGGGKTWTIPTFDGEQISETLVGVIVDWGVRRAYWPRKMSDDGRAEPPDCASIDGDKGIGFNGTAYGRELDVRYTADGEEVPKYEYDCDSCPLNEFGTKVGEDGKMRAGKACKEVRMLFVLPEGELLPYAVPLPPTSIQPVRRYFQRMASRAIPFYGVETALKLGQVKAGATTYSVSEPIAMRRLDSEEMARVREYRRGILPLLSAIEALATDLEEGPPPTEEAEVEEVEHIEL